MEETVNANISKCITSASHFGYTEYVNICNGVTRIVDWGGVDWVLCIGGLCLGAAVIALVGAFAAMIIRDC